MTDANNTESKSTPLTTALTNNVTNNVTTNLTANNQNLAVLKKQFGHCFSNDGSFDFDKFKQELTASEVELYKESYSLDWLGKSYSRLLATDEATTLLCADHSHNAEPENANSNNLLLKGDNLEVLKHLSHAYYEKVKMIYIDPPYNTGSDGFVYADDRKFTAEQLEELAGVSYEKAQQILSFTRSKSNSHSAWLTFMYPRLYIAKQLLRDDGVIFISIDDNEVAQLKLLMDEVFGEGNFIANVVWQKKYAATNDAKGFSNLHDHIIVYQKSNNFKRFLLPRTEEQNKPYKNDDKDGKGLWRSDNLLVRSYSDSGVYPIINPNTKKEYFPPEGSSWRASKTTMKNWLAENRVFFGKDGIGAPQLKRYLEEVQQGRVPTTWWTFKEVGHNDAANKELKELFNTKPPFDTPKPTSLIKQMLAISSKDNDLILDFFAGSGTTADAVMQLNSEDGGNRQFILVQLPETIDPVKKKTEYDFVHNELGVAEPTIFDITKERIIRSAKKIQVDNEEAKETDTNKRDLSSQDMGFKIYETMPIWDDYQFEIEKFHQQIELFDQSKLTEDDVQALLITWKTYDGSPLTEDCQKYVLEADNSPSYTAYYIESNASQKLYLMHQGFSTAHLTTLLQKLDSDSKFNPTSIVAFGYHFESKNLRELSENLKTYANKKSSDIDFVVRY